MSVIEIIGIIATIIIVISMCFNTTTIKGNYLMRILNIIGSLVFVIYGLILPAYSTALLNGILVFINAYRLLMLIVKQKNNKIKDKE